MRNLQRIFLQSLAWLVAIDVSVAVVLSLQVPALTPLERYFSLGRSIPGKLAAWQANPDTSDNLFDVGWIGENLEASNAVFSGPQSGQAPVIRSYGMSFVNNILEASKRLAPGVHLDLHAGPGVPPNWAYAAFLDDARNRLPGDIVVLGILSSSIPAMAALSNRTAVFEQPAPLTYPIFRSAADGGLIRLDPLVTSAGQERSLTTDPAARRGWDAQLRTQDALFSPAAFAMPVLDVSPFARLVRRALASGQIEERKRRVLEQGDWAETLRRICTGFARIARADGQVPVVMLIQTGRPGDPDLLGALGAFLDANAIPILATARIADPRDPANFVSDGHYIPEIDTSLARYFLDMEVVRTALVQP